MNEMQTLSPRNIYPRLYRQRTLDYARLDIQTHDQVDTLSSHIDSASSDLTSAALSRYQSLSYERLTVQEEVSPSQLQRHHGRDTLDLRATPPYARYLFVEKITLRIEEQFGFSAQQTDRQSGRDVSVEGAAESVFELSITIYTQYEAQEAESNAAMNPERTLSNFMGQMRQVVDQGLQDTMNILERMNDFNEDIQSTVDDLYNTLKTLLARFEEAQHQRIDKEKAASIQRDTRSEDANTDPANPLKITKQHTSQ